MGNDVSVETFDKYDYLTESEYDVVNTTTGVNETEENNNTLVFHVEGYSTFHIIIYSILLTFMMIVVVIGNMLVIIAIATEKTLKNIQNWFIASLAVADFFVGLVIMPFSLANELMGYWIFGAIWCSIHGAMDVLLCTSSIMNICLISLDRYWSITQAVDYLKKRTPARAAVMIGMVWALSGLISIPPLLGWRAPDEVTDKLQPKCGLSKEIGYVLYSAFGSFYIPSCIMVFVYIRIYFAARDRARRNVRKSPRPRPQSSTTVEEPISRNPSASVNSTPKIPPASSCHRMVTSPVELNATPSSNESPVATCHENAVGRKQVGFQEPLVSSKEPTVEVVKPEITVETCSPEDSVEVDSDNVIVKEKVDNGGCETDSMERTNNVTCNSFDDKGENKSEEINENELEEESEDSPLNAEEKETNVDKKNIQTEKESPEDACKESPDDGQPKPLIPKIQLREVAEDKIEIVPQHSSTAYSTNNSLDIHSNGARNARKSKDIATRRGKRPKLHFLRVEPPTIWRTSSSLSLNGDVHILGTLSRSCSRLQLETDPVSDVEPSSSDSGAVSRCAVVKPLKLRLCQPFFGKKSNSASGKVRRDVMDTGRLPSPKQEIRDPEREKRRIARKKEKRATLILGLIMGSFILCWLPFFFLYIVEAVCVTCVESWGFSIAFWLGYMNSALNPVIYTIFNKDFRRAFRRILFK